MVYKNFCSFVETFFLNIVAWFAAWTLWLFVCETCWCNLCVFTPLRCTMAHVGHLKSQKRTAWKMSVTAIIMRSRVWMRGVSSRPWIALLRHRTWPCSDASFSRDSRCSWSTGSNAAPMSRARAVDLFAGTSTGTKLNILGLELKIVVTYGKKTY